MSTPAIDYDALAKSSGGTPVAAAAPVDYDALAHQHGGVAVQDAQAPTAMQKVGSAAKDVALGAANSAVMGLQGGAAEPFDTSKPATPGASPIGRNSRTGQPYYAPPADATLKATNLPQKIGAGGEQVGEMALLGGGIKSLLEEAATHVPELARYLPFLRVAGEAANTGADAAAHGQPVGPAAAAGGAGAAAGEALPSLASGLRDMAETQYGKVLAATTKRNKNLSAKVVPELLDRGVTGSRESIENQATAALAKANPQLDAAYAAMPPVPIPTRLALDNLNQLKSRYIVTGENGATTQNAQAVAAIDGVAQMVRDLGPEAPPLALRKLKQIFGETADAAGAYTGGDMTSKFAAKANRVAERSIADLLNAASPNVAALNKEVSFWIKTQKVISDTNQRLEGQSGGLLHVLSPLAGVGAAAAGISHGAETSVVSGLTAMGLTAAAQAVRSPMWRSVSAVIKARLASALANGDGATVTRLLGRAGAAGVSNASGSSSPQP